MEKIKKWYKEIAKLLYNIKVDRIGECSAECAYYTILSFIPFIILLITLIQYTNIQPKTLFEAISKIIPSGMNEFVLSIVQEVYSKSIGTVSVSIIFTIWAAGKGLFALTKGLQVVYKTNEKKQSSYFGGFENFNTVSSIFTELLFIFATFLVFLLLYKFMPKHKVTFKSQLWGAVFGAIALNVVSFVFSKYLYIFKGFSWTYGSLTTLMLIMMWTYSCFYTVFLGAEFNKWVNRVRL